MAVDRDDDKANTVNSKEKIFLSNNFYNYYRNSKLNVRQHEKEEEQQHENDAPARSRVTATKRSSFRDHFLAPLTDNSPKAPSSDTNYSSPTPSVFTDTERSHVFNKFSKIFTSKIGDAISSGTLSRAWQRGGGSWLTTDFSKIDIYDKNMVNPDDYEAERDMIQPHLTPFVWGMTCSAVTLFSLRFGKWYQTRKLSDAIMKTRPNNNIVRETVPKNTKDVSTLQDLRRSKSTLQNNPLQNPRVQSFDASLENLLSLPVDTAISMLIGISTTIYLTRPAILLQDISQSPLLPGKSVLSEELCEPFTKEMRKINDGFHTYSVGDDKQKNVISYSELWRNENLGEFDSLRAVRDFVVNCGKRDDASNHE